jgi:S1-C subfamily serine protease
MVTSNILQRTFRIKFGEGAGTCFTIDVENRQYVVTARHVVEGMKQTDKVEILHDNKWVGLPVKLVGFGENDSDIALIALSEQLSPTLPLTAATNDMYLSQDVYFLGFPYGLQIDVTSEINSLFPLPLVKKAIISSFEFRGNVLSSMLLDGHNNPGFSGGPVFYSPPGTKESKVAGVISGYRYEWESVFIEQKKTELTYQSNTGIIVAWSINYALDIIRKNPIGFVLQQKAG